MARVVIADDERLAARALAAQVRRLGHDPVALAANGRAAIAAAEDHRPDVVLMDFAMPKVDGAAATRIIWDRRQIPVVMITGHGDRATVRAAGDAGALAYLMKPVAAETLRPAIDIAVRRGRDLQSARETIEILSTRLRDRKVIERAKGALMEQLHVGEEQAYRWLQRHSRNQRLRMVDLAEKIISARQPLV